MTDQSALLAAVLAAPDDDAPRLIYADWLDEHGQAERAEFIRVQCVRKNRVARVVLYLIRGVPAWRANSSVQQSHRRLVRDIPPDPNWFRNSRELFDSELIQADRIAFPCCPEAEIRRGFVRSITCSAADWFASADAIRISHPIESMILTTWPDVPMIEMLMEARPADSPFVGDSNPEIMAGLLACKWAGIKFTFSNLPMRETAEGRSRWNEFRRRYLDDTGTIYAHLLEFGRRPR